MNNIVISILSSATICAALTGFLFWLFRSWISERLKNAIKFEYDQKLGNFSAELSRLSEDRTRKLERLMRQYERQIEEFYGPLWNIIHQFYACNDTKSQLVSRLDRDTAAKVEQYYQDNYFRPLHEEMRQILKTKLYLIEGAVMPKSFYLYLRHSLQERDQRDLYQKAGIDTSFLRGESWPAGIHNDIKNGFDNAMKNYEHCLDGLKA